ncbi:hypothetical protein EP7_003213 [Isosphaeraceae bacterium EP7]
MAIATELPGLESLRDEQAALRARLAGLRRRLQLQLTLESAVEVTTVLVLAAAALVLLDWWLRPGVSARLALLAIALAAGLTFLAIRALKRWRSSKVDDLALAMTLDHYRPGVGQQIADVLQLPDLVDGPDAEAHASPAMVRLAVRRASEALAGSDWGSLWNRRRTKACLVALGLGLLVPAAFALVAPAAARLSFARWLLGSSERWPQRTYLTVMGLDSRGMLIAPRGERFQVEVRGDMPLVDRRGDRWAVGGRGEPLVLAKKPSKPGVPAAVSIRERTAEGARRDAVMVASGPAQFRHELPASPTPSTFELTANDDWLGPIRVERVDRPTLADLRLSVREPGATYEGARNVADPRQHLLFLPDTEVEFTFVGSEPLAGIRLNVHPGSPPVVERIDPKTFKAKWVLHEATTLEVVLTSASNGLTSQPNFLSISIQRDREPRITMRAVGVGTRVTPVATIPLTIGATDDLGLAALRIQADRTTPGGDSEEPKTARKTIPLPLPQDSDRAVLDQQFQHDVLLQAEPPKVGTILRFVAEADDRCARGAQTGRSGTLQLMVVSVEELFYEILIRQRAERAKFVAALEGLEKQTPTLATEAPPEDVLKVLRAHHSASRLVDQIAGRLTDTLQEMKLNQVGTPKSHRLLQEAVIDPTKALSAGPMNATRAALQPLSSPAGGKQSDRETARRLHDEVVTKMKAILDQMSQWESFIDVVNQVAEVIRMQQGVLQSTEKARESRTQEVFDDKP